MSFNSRNFFRLIYLVLTRWEETGLPRTPRRALAQMAFFSLYPIYEVFNHLCFFLDDVLYPGWKRTSLEQPVFIIGNPRSGTTLLHRIMAKDTEHFFTFHTWELLFPAISQKKFLLGLARLNHFTKGALERKLRQKETEFFGEFNKIHRIGLFYPEEDDKLLFHHCSFHGLAWLFPFEEIKRYHKFDVALPEDEKKRILEFYEQMLRRQAFFTGGRKRLLSKNPASSLKVRGLLRTFPNCRIIYLVRHPLEVVPSTINMAHALWRRMAGVEHGAYPYLEGVYEIVRAFYEYPIRVLDDQPKDSYRFVRYEDLVRKPARVVQDLYRWLNIEISASFDQILAEEEQKAQAYVSQHVYSLEDMEISPARIVQDLDFVFERFGYDVNSRHGHTE